MAITKMKPSNRKEVNETLKKVGNRSTAAMIIVENEHLLSDQEKGKWMSQFCIDDEYLNKTAAQIWNW